jgi:hypothetical protein
MKRQLLDIQQKLFMKMDTKPCVSVSVPFAVHAESIPLRVLSEQLTSVSVMVTSKIRPLLWMNVEDVCVGSRKFN